MAGGNRFSRADPNATVVLSGRQYNDIVTEIERGRIEVAYPLKKLAEGSEGIVLGCTPVSGPSSPSTILVSLQKDGGYDGDAATYTSATWTYTGTDVNSGKTLFYQLGLFGQRPFLSKTVPATCGLVYQVNEVSKVGMDGAGVGGGSGSGGSGGSSGPINLWRITWCDEQFPLCAYTLGSGGSGSGG
jgi:hypothetical protein